MWSGGVLGLRYYQNMWLGMEDTPDEVFGATDTVRHSLDFDITSFPCASKN